MPPPLPPGAPPAAAEPPRTYPLEQQNVSVEH
jgi:hypothetical protein